MLCIHTILICKFQGKLVQVIEYVKRFIFQGWCEKLVKSEDTQGDIRPRERNETQGDIKTTVTTSTTTTTKFAVLWILTDYWVKIRQSEKIYNHLDLVTEQKNTVGHESEINTNCNRCSRKGARNQWKYWNHCWGRLEYWEESWRLKETCCYPDFCGKPSVLPGVKKLQEVK